MLGFWNCFSLNFHFVAKGGRVSFLIFFQFCSFPKIAFFHIPGWAWPITDESLSSTQTRWGCSSWKPPSGQHWRSPLIPTPNRKIDFPTTTPPNDEGNAGHERWRCEGRAGLHRDALSLDRLWQRFRNSGSTG